MKYDLIVKLLFPFLLLLLVSCAHVQTGSQTPEEILANRIEAFLTFRESEDYENMYPFLSPAFRKKYPFTAYVKRSNIKYLDSKIILIDMNTLKDAAIVELSTTRKALGFVFKDSLEKMQWIKVDGNWYYDLSTKPAGF